MWLTLVALLFNIVLFYGDIGGDILVGKELFAKKFPTDVSKGTL